MNKLPREIHNDNKYIPSIALNTESYYHVGKWGRMHKDYMKENRPDVFNDMLLSGCLWNYLNQLNDQADARFRLIIKELKEAENVTEELRRHSQKEWVMAMNSIVNRAERIVIHELIMI